MGRLKKLLGTEQRDSEAPGFEVRSSDLEDPDHVEVDVVGEGFVEDTLARIAGGKSAEGKQLRVGATLRCEPTNPHDAYAVRVEVMGQLVGYLPRASATKASPGLTRAGGAIEGQGLIVGGRKTETTKATSGSAAGSPSATPTTSDFDHRSRLPASARLD